MIPVAHTSPKSSKKKINLVHKQVHASIQIQDYGR